MPYWICYYHAIWATKHRQPAILTSYESIITAAIEEKTNELGCKIVTVNMVSDHVHVAVSIPPSMAGAKWVGAVKGASARAVNIAFELNDRFHWQEGYGLLTFGEKALPQVVEYISSQQARHAKGDLNTYLERVEE